MRPLAILPVKRLDSAKQRLAGALSAADRELLAAAMLADVLERIAGCEMLAGVLVVSGDRRARGIAASAGADLLDDPDDAGHPRAAALGVEEALRRKRKAVALLPGDCPLVDPAGLDAALERLEEVPVVVVPDRHGEGTNGLLMRPPGAIDPAFGPGSRRRHLELARRAGLPAEVANVGSMALDLDTPADLRALAEAVSGAGDEAPRRTREALAALGLLAAPSGR